MQCYFLTPTTLELFLILLFIYVCFDKKNDFKVVEYTLTSYMNKVPYYITIIKKNALLILRVHQFRQTKD